MDNEEVGPVVRVECKPTEGYYLGLHVSLRHLFVKEFQLVRGLSVRQSCFSTSFNTSQGGSNNIGRPFVTTNRSVGFVIGTFGGRKNCFTLRHSLQEVSGFCVFQASSGISQLIVTRSFISAYPANARGLCGFIFCRNSIGSVTISSGVNGGYIFQFIMGIFQDASLLSVSLVRSGGNVKRNRYFFLVINSVCGDGSGFFFRASRLVLRTLTRFWVGYAG